MRIYHQYVRVCVCVRVCVVSNYYVFSVDAFAALCIYVSVCVRTHALYATMAVHVYVTVCPSTGADGRWKYGPNRNYWGLLMAI